MSIEVKQRLETLESEIDSVSAAIKRAEEKRGHLEHDLAGLEVDLEGLWAERISMEKEKATLQQV